ncbi:NK-tumor recognition protein-like [Portunus trituberculatus]|uniref:NK-tumor recognition protein-like n=1 Tax=Portunus trituberculatus TaxID=210409 RepID=UPI001E1CD494|nr:NK-tumor recognition protein-like [Portunus trituberculatus]
MRGEVGSPEACEHTFCLICILEWAKTNPSCPQDRKAFTKVLVRLTLQTEKVDREIPIKKQESELVLISETDNPTYCEVCNECDREERLLLCDGCDLGYHLECLDPPLDQVPVEEWFCPSCTSAELPSTVRVRQTPQSESSTSQERPRRQQSSSQRPRLIPRTRATERVRDRIIRKRKEKRKKRRLNRKRKIESGEIDDPRPSVDCKERLLFFGSIDNEVPAEDANDTFADHLLAGVSEWANSRNTAGRKNDAIKILRDAAFTPSTSYAGKASMAVINRVNNQAEETREDDVLSSILENQSIVLTTSKKLSLTSDRKFKKEDEASDAESFSLKQEESSLMTEPLPSRRSTQKDDEERGTSREDERRHFSPPRRTFQYSFSHHPSYSHKSRYEHSSRGFESNHRPQREERGFREERIEREERPSGTVHQSPLEDRRRSPPRMSYQRQMPSHQFRNQRNAPPNNRNCDPHARWDERQRSQRSPPWKDFVHRQNPSNDTYWGRRQNESSGSSSREPSSQERYGKNDRNNSKEISSYRSHRPSSDKRGSSPPSGVHDKYPRRSEDGDKLYSRREEDRHKKEERGYYRQYHQRDHSHHRGYKSSYRTEKESLSSCSSHQSRSYSRSPGRSMSPIRSRSPARSRSRSHSRLRETRGRDRDDTKRRRNPHQHSDNNNESAFRASKSPMSPEGILNDSQQQSDSKVTPGNGADVVCSHHFSKVHDLSSKPSFEIPEILENKFMEARSRSIKDEIKEQKSTLAEGSLKVPRGIKREEENIKSDNTYCNSDITDQKPVPEVMNLRKAESKIFGKEKKGSDFGVKIEDSLLNDTKIINFSVQSNCKRDHKRDKFHDDAEGVDSRKDGNGSDTLALQSINHAKCINREQESKNEITSKEENQPERKKRKKFLSGFFGRILEYTPEVELSHWDENSSEDVASPFKVIRKSDVRESDKGISLPFSLQRLLPGEGNISGESDERINTTKEENPKQKSDSGNRYVEGKNLEVLKNKGCEIQKSGVGMGNIKKEQENMSEDKHHKKKSGHKTTKVDTKSLTSKPKDSVLPSSSHSIIPESKSKERSTDKATMESQSQTPNGKDGLVHSSGKRERTQSASQMCDHPSTEIHEHNYKRGSTEKTEDFQNIFGDISDLSDTDSDNNERNKKLLKGSFVTEKSSVKQNGSQETKHKFMYDKEKEKTKKGEHEKNILKDDEYATKTQKLEGTVFIQKEKKSKNQGKGTKNVKPNKGHVLDLFGDNSDSDDVDNVKIEEMKLPEKLLKSSSFKDGYAHRKGREATDIHKGRERKSERETSFHRKSSEEPSKSSSESFKHDVVHKKGKETTNSIKRENKKSEKETSLYRKLSEEAPKCESVIDSHNRKDRKSEKEICPLKKPSEEAPKSSLEIFKDDSVQKQQEEDTGISKEKDVKSEKETSLYMKSLEEPTKSLSELSRGNYTSVPRREVLENHKEKNIKSEKESLQHKKISEEPSKSFSESLECGLIHFKGKEAAGSHKRKDKKSEKEASPHKKSSQELSRSSSESFKHDSLHRKEKEISDSHKEDIKSQKESSPSKKSSEELFKLSSELFELESSHRKAREVIDSHKRKDKKSEKKTSPHSKSEEPSKINFDLGKIRESLDSHEEQTDECSQQKQKKIPEKPLKAEQPKSDSGTDKVKEAAINHEEQKDGCSEQTLKKMSEKPGKAAASEKHDQYTDHKKTTDIPIGQSERDKKLTHPEDYSKRKTGCSLHVDGDHHNNKKKKSSSYPAGKIQREKDPVCKTESKSLVAATSSLQSTTHSSDRREKKDGGDSHAKQLKASLELKVVAEVKKWLDPHYRDKSITKEEYKEIVAKCVSKVVSAECGDVIESEKMHSLVEGYVKLYRHRRAKLQVPPSS